MPAANRRYIHHLPSWPKFTWQQETLTPVLVAVRHKQGLLLGKMAALGFDLRKEASLVVLTSEVVTSSAIEGEHLDPKEVRSSLAKRLGLDAAGLPKPGRDVDGVVQMMLDATQQFAKPLTKSRLYDWHTALFPTGRSGLVRITVGAWRKPEHDPMQVVSGRAGRQKVHFEAPNAARLESEMRAFLDWFNAQQAVDPVITAGVAHLWFVTIHPFADGNGRIARAIADMALARADATKERFYSMSAQIERERKEYYRQLEATQKGGMDITPWLEWFLRCLDRAIAGAEESLKAVLSKARLWEQINRRPVNERQRKVINKLLNGFEGVLTTSKYAKLGKCSTDTALRDIQELVERKVLAQNKAGGRSTSYRVVGR